MYTFSDVAAAMQAQTLMTLIGLTSDEACDQVMNWWMEIESRISQIEQNFAGWLFNNRRLGYANMLAEATKFGGANLILMPAAWNRQPLRPLVLQGLLDGSLERVKAA